MAATKRDFVINYGLQTDNSGTSTGNTLFVDQTNDKVGVGTKTPTEKLDVNGNLKVSGISTFQNNVYLLDDDELLIGGSAGDHDGLKIYHSTSGTEASYIQDTGSGVLYIDAFSSINLRRYSNQDKLASFNAGGPVELYYDNSKKFETTTTGISVTGGLQVNGYITESTDNGTTYWNVVTQQDIGYAANQVPLNQYLGQLAFLDDFSPNGLRREGGGFDDVVVDSNGNVGIGNTNPTAKLDVNGTLNVIDTITSPRFISTQETGTAPFAVASDTLVTNLNADLLDGNQGSYYTNASNLSEGTIPDDRFPTEIPSNAATATKLATAVNIGGVSFDGSSDISLPGVNTSGDQDTSGNAATATKLATAVNIGGVSFDGSANIDLPGVNTSGDQDTSGNAATATKLQTPRTIALSGDVSGSTSFDGSGDVTITATVSDDSHNHIISNVDGLQSALDLKAPLESPVLSGTPTAPTADAGTNTTQVATTEFVSTAVANLVDTAPATLDTLNELAAALGDDPNFATTISNQIGDKLDSADYTAADVLTKIKTVDGASSGLDADLLDGIDSSSFLRSDEAGTATGLLTLTNGLNVTGGNIGIGTAIDIVPYDSLNNGTLSFEGSAGQLFSITNNLTSGSIFSVNDVSGIPSIDVDADGTISLASYGGNVGVGTNTPTEKLDVSGTVKATTFESTVASGTAPFTVSSTTVVTNLNADLLDGNQGSYYTNASNLSEGTIPDDRFPATISSNITGNANTATTLETPRTIGGVSFDGSVNIDLPGVNTSGDQDTSGNANTATTLETPRTIGGVSFDGSVNIDLPGVNTSGDQDTSGNAATATKLATAVNIGGVSFDGSVNIDLPGVNTAGNQDTSGNANTATTLETPRTIGGVSFDGSVNIDLPGVNTSGDQDTSGNAATATKLATARTITLSGDVSGSTSFDGSGDVTITATVSDDSHNHIISNVDGLQSALDLKAPLESPVLSGTPTAPTASAGTNTTQVATTEFVSTAVANLVDTAPETLDTLNELAAALGDDANFSTNITNSIATKLSLSGGQMTGNITFSGAQTVDGRDLSVDGAKLDGIEAGATADQTKEDIDALNIDAGTLDGQEGTYYLDYNNFTNKPTIGNGTLTVQGSSGLTGSGTFTANQTTNATITVSHADTSSVANLTASPRTYVTALTFDDFGHVTEYSTSTETVVDTNTTYGISAAITDGGANLSLTGSDSSNDDVKFAQGSNITISSTDANTITIASTDTTYSAGDGLTLTSTVFRHADTSTQASVDNANGTVIQDITLDTFGHITAIGSINLDAKYLGINANGDVGIGTDDPQNKLEVNGYITESTDSGTSYWNVVTQQDIGYAANQVPLNQYLGQLAFLDDFSPNGLRRKNGGSDDLVVGDDGTIGIGTDTIGVTGYALEVRGNVYLNNGGNGTDTLYLNNGAITGVNSLKFNDPGPNEGLIWNGGNGWQIYESPNDLTTNDAGNLQFVVANSRVLTLDTEGNAEFTGSVNISGNAEFTGSVNISGNTTFQDEITFQSDAYFGDNVVLNFGTDNDLQIYHDGNNSYINQTPSSTGDLFLIGNGRLVLQTHSPFDSIAENSIVCNEDGAVELYYNNTKKFETTDLGVKIGSVININSYDDLYNGTLSFNGTYGPLFTISNNSESGLFNISDISGIPSFNIDQYGTVVIAPYGVNEYVGIGVEEPTSKLHINSGTGYYAFNIEGSAGQLFSVTNNLTEGSIFSVNDVSGIPSIDVDADGTVAIAPFNGNVGVGKTTPTEKLDVNGTVKATLFSGSGASLTDIPNGALVNSTISGVSLGDDLYTLTLNTSGTGLSGSTTYNGSGDATFTVTSNATDANTPNTIVSRDTSGNFSANTITLEGELRGPSVFIIDPSAVGDNTGTVTILGNLQVEGTQTIINSTTLTVDDKNIVLASGALDGTAADGAGITIDGASATLTYDSNGDKWVFNKEPHYSSYKLLTTADEGTLDAGTLDNLDSTQFLRSDEADTATGLLTLTNGLNVTGGNVGIGNTNPQNKLEVNGYITESTDNGTTYWNVVTQQDIGYAANQVPLNQYLGQLAFLDDFSPNGLRREGGGSDDVVVDSNGNVGVGIANPNSKLDVNGNITATSFYGSGSNLTGIVTSIVAGDNITISGSTGEVTINSSGGSGEESINPFLLMGA